MSTVKGFGVTTNELEQFFNSSGDNISENFIGVFPADQKNEFFDVKENLKQKRAKYPFMVANTDPARKPGVHWWSFLDIEEKILCSFFIRLVATGY